jgi:hypothetical protein
MLSLEAHPGADNFFDAVSSSQQGEAPTVIDKASRLSGYEDVIPIVIHSNFHGKRSRTAGNSKPGIYNIWDDIRTDFTRALKSPRDFQ